MKSLKWFGIIVTVALFATFTKSDAGTLGPFVKWIYDHWGQRIAIPGPAYSPCDLDVMALCLKEGEMRVYGEDTSTYTDYRFAWVPSMNTAFDDISGTSIYNIDLVNNTYDIQVNTTSNTLQFNATTFQDVLDYYNNK